MIHNTGWLSAIKRIAILRSENGAEYHDLIQIDGIQTEDNNRQWFIVDDDQIRFVMFLMVNILETNRKSNGTSFREFGVVRFM